MEHRTNPVLATVVPIAGVGREVTATVVVHPAGAALRERHRSTARGSAPPMATPAALPSEAAPAVTREVPGQEGATATDHLRSEDGSLVTEYGLLAVVAATLAGAVMSWASNGALVTLFNALLRQARALVGA